VRRAFRIFPVYWAVVLALTALGPVGQRLAGAPAGDWFAFLLNLLALSHLYPPALAGFDVTAVSWSLTVELGWYLVAPLLALLWGMRPTTGVDARQAASRLAQAAPGPRAPAGRKAVTGTVLVFVAVSVAWVWLAQRGAFDRVFLEVLWAGQVGPMTDFLRYAYLVNAAPANSFLRPEPRWHLRTCGQVGPRFPRDPGRPVCPMSRLLWLSRPCQARASGAWGRGWPRPPSR
jgi:peptidoglycan/LPS O-acetylase OafA/YrhL